MRFGPRQSGSARRGIICDRCHGQSGRRQRMSDRTRILALVAALGVAYFGSTILLLSLLTADYNPITQAASDYGVGRFALEMNLGFLIGGIGLVSLALALFLQRTGPTSRVRSILLVIAGLVLVMDAYFNYEPRRGSSHLARNNSRFWRLIFFITAPIGMLLVFRRFGRSKFLTTLVALIIGFLFLVANAVLSLNAGGLAERILLLVVFSSAIAASLTLFRISTDTGSSTLGPVSP